MPGFLLHANAMVTCMHAGVATPMTVIPYVQVMGQPIVVMSATYGIVGCTNPTPPVANGPCLTAEWVTASTAVSSNGNPVLLADSQAICTPTPTPLLISTTQTVVAGI